MSGGWEGSDRKQRLPEDWRSLRSRVLLRAKHVCEARDEIKPGGLVKRCWRVATDVDHIVAGDDHSMSNLQALCRYHHGKKSAQEGVEARRKPPAKRTAEKHPGDLS